MPSSVQPVNNVPFRPRGTAKQHNQKLQAYLQSIHWSEEQISQERLEIMLAAACLRFLGGFENLSFVLGLSQEIRSKYKTKIHRPLQRSTNILHELSEKLRNKSISLSDAETIVQLVNDAQEALTERRWYQ